MCAFTVFDRHCQSAAGLEVSVGVTSRIRLSPLIPVQHLQFWFTSRPVSCILGSLYATFVFTALARRMHVTGFGCGVGVDVVFLDVRYLLLAAVVSARTTMLHSQTLDRVGQRVLLTELPCLRRENFPHEVATLHGMRVAEVDARSALCEVYRRRRIMLWWQNDRTVSATLVGVIQEWGYLGLILSLAPPPAG
nr:hypothetical protein [Diaporthe pseudophoenicicola chrysovirus 1]